MRLQLPFQRNTEEATVEHAGANLPSSPTAASPAQVDKERETVAERRGLAGAIASPQEQAEALGKRLEWKEQEQRIKPLWVRVVWHDSLRYFCFLGVVAYLLLPKAEEYYKQYQESRPVHVATATSSTVLMEDGKAEDLGLVDEQAKLLESLSALYTKKDYKSVMASYEESVGSKVEDQPALRAYYLISDVMSQGFQVENLEGDLDLTHAKLKPYVDKGDLNPDLLVHLNACQAMAKLRSCFRDQILKDSSPYFTDKLRQMPTERKDSMEIELRRALVKRYRAAAESAVEAKEWGDARFFYQYALRFCTEIPEAGGSWYNEFRVFESSFETDMIEILAELKNANEKYHGIGFLNNNWQETKDSKIYIDVSGNW